eukprot:TRINITY_DN15994_c0_g1_i3.p1 TRINITY_DN15994_c0_g1~~TRINITY_DN15994_c0_g1_i3.p1  ORF type:complete len:324 (-),score=38.22 TRINITY_DN15994_c0_g1_i3:124-1044(-)
MTTADELLPITDIEVTHSEICPGVGFSLAVKIPSTDGTGYLWVKRGTLFPPITAISDRGVYRHQVCHEMEKSLNPGHRPQTYLSVSCCDGDSAIVNISLSENPDNRKSIAVNCQLGRRFLTLQTLSEDSLNPSREQDPISNIEVTHSPLPPSERFEFGAQVRAKPNSDAIGYLWVSRNWLGREITGIRVDHDAPDSSDFRFRTNRTQLNPGGDLKAFIAFTCEKGNSPIYDIIVNEELPVGYQKVNKDVFRTTGFPEAYLWFTTIPAVLRIQDLHHRNCRLFMAVFAYGSAHPFLSTTRSFFKQVK